MFSPALAASGLPGAGSIANSGGTMCMRAGVALGSERPPAEGAKIPRSVLPREPRIQVSRATHSGPSVGRSQTGVCWPSAGGRAGCERGGDGTNGSLYPKARHQFRGHRLFSPAASRRKRGPGEVGLVKKCGCRRIGTGFSSAITRAAVSQGTGVAKDGLASRTGRAPRPANRPFTCSGRAAGPTNPPQRTTTWAGDGFISPTLTHSLWCLARDNPL